MSAQISGPDDADCAGRRGLRYWVHAPYGFTHNSEVDARLSGFPLFVFLPAGRTAAETPVVLLLQGMAAPWHWSSWAIPALLDMGIACVTFDHPLAGERSLVPHLQGNMLDQLVPLLRRKVSIRPELVGRMVEAMTHDIRTAFDLAADRQGLGSPRRGLFGISMGGIYASQAFIRDGIGQRLLLAMSQPDLFQFAGSYGRFFKTGIVGHEGRVEQLLPDYVRGGLQFARALNEIRAGGDHCVLANPMTHIDRVGRDRRVRLMVGSSDSQCSAKDAVQTAARFPDGECYVVPGWGHGGPDTERHCLNFLRSQLADWAQA